MRIATLGIPTRGIATLRNAILLTATVAAAITLTPRANAQSVVVYPQVPSLVVPIYPALPPLYIPPVRPVPPIAPPVVGPIVPIVPFPPVGPVVPAPRGYAVYYRVAVFTPWQFYGYFTNLADANIAARQLNRWGYQSWVTRP